MSTTTNASGKTVQIPHDDTEKNRRSTIQVVEFRLGNEHYAIDLYDVREVVENSTITRLPNTPQYLKGVIDLRGEITTIIDLNERLSTGTDRTDIAEENRRIIVLDENLTTVKIGIIVDEVLSVSTFEHSDVDKTSSSVCREDSAILGIIRKKMRIHEKDVSELIVWIDIQCILEDIGCNAQITGKEKSLGND